jgi:hypothetical protein
MSEHPVTATYTVIFGYGDTSTAQSGMTLADAARALLWNDGAEFEIRADDAGHSLWCKRLNGRWLKSVLYSVSDDPEAEIFGQVVTKPADWWSGAEAMTDEEFAKMQAEAEG